MCSSPVHLWAQLGCLQAAGRHCGCGAAIHSQGQNLTARERSSALGLRVWGERCCVSRARHSCAAGLQPNGSLQQQRAVHRLCHEEYFQQLFTHSPARMHFVPTVSRLSTVQRLLADLGATEFHSSAWC